MKRLTAILMGLIFCFCTYAQSGQSAGKAVEGANHEYMPGEKIEQRFTLYYNLSEIDIDPDFLENTDQMDTIRRYLAKSPEIDSIVVYSYASPEGPYKNNARLADKRAEAAKEFILQGAKKPIRIITVPTPENWGGLYEEIKANYHRPDRDEIISILEDRTIDNDVRERKIKQHKESYRYILENHMPRLRKATWVCVWVVPKPDVKPVKAPVSKAVTEDRCRVLPPPPAEPSFYTPALKTNILYDLTTTLNVSAEFPIGERFSIMVEDTFPWWNGGPHGNRWCYQLWEIGIEPRWWFRQKGNLQGHFLGVYGKSAKYDFQYDTALCYQGEYWSTGLSYGYAMKLGKHLNLEFSLSVGFVQSDYRHYQPSPEYEHLYINRYKTGTFSYFGPTKLAVSFVLPINFKTKKK